MTDGGEQGGRAIPVLNIGAMNGEADEQAGGVGDNVAFASLDLLSGIIARNTAAFSGFDALAVVDAGRRTGLAAHRFPGRHDKMLVDLSQTTSVGLVAEIPAHRGDRREVDRQLPPLTTSACQKQRT